ncbi:MAG: hypothetical protein ACRCZ1_05730 [Cetobacterium sp.]
MSYIENLEKCLLNLKTDRENTKNKKVKELLTIKIVRIEKELQQIKYELENIKNEKRIKYIENL